LEYATQQRHKLETKIANAFSESMSILSPEMQRILADDMVTAFQNRLIVLIRIQSKTDTSKTERVDLNARLEKARELMKKLKPIELKLKRGVQMKLDEELIAEKTEDGKIVLYEVVE